MALSDDLRKRVVEAVVLGGLSRNAAARRLGVSIASAVRLVARYKTTGQISPSPSGGDRRSGRIEAQRGYLLGLIRRTPDITARDPRAPDPKLRRALFGLRDRRFHQSRSNGPDEGAQSLRRRLQIGRMHKLLRRGDGPQSPSGPAASMPPALDYCDPGANFVSQSGLRMLVVSLVARIR